MARIDQLLESYRRHVSLAPRGHLPLSQRVWFVVYPPEEERRMANRIPEFEIATRDKGWGWRRIDLKGAFADWMDTFDLEERKKCLADPDIVETYADPGFAEYLGDRLRRELDRRLLDQLPPEGFRADDALGWTYQFWQAKRKEQINKSGVKIGADELPAVTQLFTEDYMVEFLLHNSIGAWWAGRRAAVDSGQLSVASCPTEADARRAVSLPTKDGLPGIDWTYLRFARSDADAENAAPDSLTTDHRSLLIGAPPPGPSTAGPDAPARSASWTLAWAAATSWSSRCQSWRDCGCRRRGSGRPRPLPLPPGRYKRALSGAGQAIELTQALLRDPLSHLRREERVLFRWSRRRTGCSNQDIGHIGITFSSMKYGCYLPGLGLVHLRQLAAR